MTERKIEIVVDEHLARRLRARAAAAQESLEDRARQHLVDWLGDWGLNFAVHVVKSGETLALISRQYYGDTSKVAVIAAFNEIENPNLIRVGQVLRLPEAQAPQEPQPKEPLPVGESPYIFGMHDRGAEGLMQAAGRKGWVLVTEALGANRNDWGSQSYRDLADQGFGVIVRLNNGYGQSGTLPRSAHYADFAVRCGNFVERSEGCHIWIIANEPNLAVERPGGPANGEVITPAKYAQAFLACRQEIRRRSGHGSDQVVMAAVGPWNIQTIYSENPSGDWIVYFQQVLERLGDQVDGIALHTYARDPYPANVTSELTMDPPYHHRRKMFRTYIDFMEAIPAAQRRLPVYITETNQNGSWEDLNRGWIQAAYAEINRWNSDSSRQPIRALLLYRWERHAGDIWWISGKNQVIADLSQALQKDYRWYR
jgi:LysM repeat protein